MSFLSILPSQTLNEIKEELSNVEVLKQKHPECEIKYFKGKLIETMKNYEKQQNNMTSKLEVGGKIKHLLPKLQSNDMKIILDAINRIKVILKDKNKPISCNGLEELDQILLKGFNDNKNNKSLIRHYISLINQMSESIGQDFYEQAKQYSIMILMHISDKFGMLKQEVLQSIETINKNQGLEIFGQAAIQLLSGQNRSSEIKIELLQIINANSTNLHNLDIKSLIQELLYLLVSKNNKIRNLSQQILQNILKNYDKNIFNQFLNELKPLHAQQIHQILKTKKASNSGQPAEQNTTSHENNTQSKFEKTQNSKRKFALLTKEETNKEQTLKRVKMAQDSQNKFEDYHLHQQKELQVNSLQLKQKQPPAQNINQKQQNNSQQFEMKKQRLLKEKTKSYSFNGIEPDMIQDLQNQCKIAFNLQFARNMFEEDSQKKIQLIHFFLDQNPLECGYKIINISDLIVKWCFINSFSTIFEFAKNILKFFKFLIQIFQAEKFPFQEFEVKFILVSIKNIMNQFPNQFSLFINLLLNEFCQITNPQLMASFWVDILLKNTGISGNLQAEIVGIIQQNFINYLQNDVHKLMNSSKIPKKLKSVLQQKYCIYEIPLASQEQDPNFDFEFLNDNSQINRICFIKQIEQNLELIQKGTLGQKIESLMFFQNILSDVTLDLSQSLSQMDVYDNIIISLVSQLKYDLRENRNLCSEVYLEQLIITILKINSNRSLLEIINQKTFKVMIDTLFELLLFYDEVDSSNDKDLNKNIQNLLNTIIIKNLENSQKDKISSIYFDFLQEYKEQIELNNSQLQKKYNIIIRCLLKIVKAYKKIYKEISPQNLLKLFTLYIKKLNTIERNESKSDLVLKLIKSWLYEMAEIYREELIIWIKKTNEEMDWDSSQLLIWSQNILEQLKSSVQSQNIEKFSLQDRVNSIEMNLNEQTNFLIDMKESVIKENNSLSNSLPSYQTNCSSEINKMSNSNNLKEKIINNTNSPIQIFYTENKQNDQIVQFEI